MEAKKKKEEEGTLLIMLTYLDRKYPFLDTMLEREYNLSRMSLAKIRNGDDLPRAHVHYFKTLLGVMEELRQKYRRDMNEERHREVKDLMFDLMLREALGNRVNKRFV